MSATTSSPLLKLRAVSGSIVSCSPVLVSTPNGSAVAFAVGSTVRLVSIKTGLLLGCYTGHSKSIVAVRSTPAGLASLSKDGGLRVWDMAFNTLESYEVGEEVMDMHLDGDIVVITQGSPRSGWTVKQFFPKTSTLSEVLSAPYTTSSIALVALPAGTVLLVASKDAVTAQRLDGTGAPGKSIKIMVLGDEPTCLTVGNGLLAVGQRRGRIELFRGLLPFLTQILTPPAGNTAEVAVRRASATLHWHAHGVCTLAISPLGLLYSAANEGVLAVWALGTTNAKGNKPERFLPRLGAGVLHIACSSEEVLMGLRDNSIRIVDPANLEVRWSLTLPSLPPRTSSALTSHGHTVCTASSTAGCLHLLSTSSSPSTSEEVCTSSAVQVVTCSALVPQFRPSVVLRALTQGYLLTVDEVVTEDTEVVQSLKVWTRDGLQVKLLSQMDSPHLRGRVTCLTASSTSSGALTVVTGDDSGLVKIWSLGTASGVWSTSSLHYREAPITSLVVSTDGSVLLLGCAGSIAVASPRTLTIVAIIPMRGMDVLSMAIVEPRHALGGNGTAYLLAATSSEVVAFDLLSRNRLWAFPAQIKSLSTASEEASVLRLRTSSGELQEAWVAVTYRTSEEVKDVVALFHPASGTPLAICCSGCHLLGSAFTPEGVYLSATEGVLYALQAAVPDAGPDTSSEVQGVQQVARIKPSALTPIVITSSSTSSSTSSVVLPASTSSAVAAVVAPRKRLSSYFAEHTADLARPSQLTDSFLSDMLQGAKCSHTLQQGTMAFKMPPTAVLQQKALGQQQGIKKTIPADAIKEVLERRLSLAFAHTPAPVAAAKGKAKAKAPAVATEEVHEEQEVVPEVVEVISTRAKRTRKA